MSSNKIINIISFEDMSGLTPREKFNKIGEYFETEFIKKDVIPNPEDLIIAIHPKDFVALEINYCINKKSNLKEDMYTLGMYGIPIMPNDKTIQEIAKVTTAGHWVVYDDNYGKKPMRKTISTALMDKEVLAPLLAKDVT